MLTMCKPANNPYSAPEYAASLVRADALEREITDLCAQINAANYRLLQLIVALENEKPWGAWGLTSCAHWLNWRCGIGMNAAREKVRVAHALVQLPDISKAFSRGELSFSKVRALTRIADSGNESELLHLASHATAAQVEKLVRSYRRVERLQENERATAQRASRGLTYYYDEDGSLVIHARLPADEGALVLQALEAAMDAQKAAASKVDEPGDVTAVTPEATGDNPESADVTAVTPAAENRPAQRRADALTTMAQTTLRHGPESTGGGERYQVVVHVAAETLAMDAAGRCELESGQRLATDTVRRIACDSSLLRVTEDQAGNPLDIGRKTRVVSPALRRALQARDGGCRFPGCTHRRHIDAHHIEHWANGGETSIDNLVLLCRHHHHLVHEGRFGLEHTANDHLRFTRPDGRVIDAHPAPPATGSVEGLRGNLQAVDASSWIIPADPLDYSIAIEGLMRIREREPGRTAYSKPTVVQ
jgi:hypothetical protein